MSGVETEASLRQEFGAPRAATQMIGLDDRPDGAAATNALGLLDVAAITEHVKIIHRLARPLAGNGKLVVASFGEDPDKLPPLKPKIRHFQIGDVEAMVAEILALAGEPHRNVYTPLAVFRLDLPPGKKGSEEDIVGVIGIVSDFDDAEAGRWTERLPMAPC